MTNYDAWKLASPPYCDEGPDLAAVADFYCCDVEEVTERMVEDYPYDLREMYEEG